MLLKKYETPLLVSFFRCKHMITNKLLDHLDYQGHLKSTNEITMCSMPTLL